MGHISGLMAELEAGRQRGREAEAERRRGGGEVIEAERQRGQANGVRQDPMTESLTRCIRHIHRQLPAALSS